MKKLIVLAALAALAFSPVLEVEAASKKKTSSRSDFSKAQQKKYFDEALKLCRKAYGGHLHHVIVDYRRKKYVCYHY
ncbi:MAG: hypothetical protein Q7T14_13390 [Aestuariivirga sp.]|nr:hypothetical protein [Aestuariivirga sp.]